MDGESCCSRATRSTTAISKSAATSTIPRVDWMAKKKRQAVGPRVACRRPGLHRRTRAGRVDPICPPPRGARTRCAAKRPSRSRLESAQLVAERGPLPSRRAAGLRGAADGNLHACMARPSTSRRWCRPCSGRPCSRDRRAGARLDDGAAVADGEDVLETRVNDSSASTGASSSRPRRARGTGASGCPCRGT